MQTGDVILRVDDLVKHFPGSRVGGRKRRMIRAVQGVSFELRQGETLGIVGESGCGKTTVARTLVGLEEPTAGEAWFHQASLFDQDAKGRNGTRRAIQMVFQDPFGALNPRLSVEASISEPWDIHGTVPRKERHERVVDLLEKVGMDESHSGRYPSELSGGQLQRVGIARALALDPEIVICDEPVSALDVSVQAQVINLLQDLLDSTGVAYIFIAHDLEVVRHIADRIAVMYLGRIVETGSTGDLFRAPTHPYTSALLSAMPGTRPDGQQRIILEGDLPDPENPPSGCGFRTRCWKAKPICATDRPELSERSGGQLWSACHFPEESGQLEYRA